MPRILVVDDEPGNLECIARVLNLRGYTVARADSAHAAIDQSRVRIFDLAILDVILPTLDGVALAKRLRDLHPGLPVLFVSGYSRERLEEHFGELGSNFLQKPFLGQELSATVDACFAASTSTFESGLGQASA